jgi:mannose-6-phosphate isomerase-like protein (cupin superfamily)
MKLHNLNELFGHLIKDEASDIQTLAVIQGDTSLLIAELKAGKKLPAHYHTRGSEIYQVLSGQGRVELGQLNGDNTIRWEYAFDLRAGDVFEVYPHQVHRLSGGAEDLRLIFFTPPSHLGDDRIFIN